MKPSWESKLDDMILRGKFNIGEVKDLFQKELSLAHQEGAEEKEKEIRKGVEEIRVVAAGKELEGMADIFRNIWEEKYKPAVLALLRAGEKTKGQKEEPPKT